jgi:hypothetical protein
MKLYILGYLLGLGIALSAGSAQASEFVQIPEPASYGALLFGAMIIGFISWKRGAPSANSKA